MIVGSENGQLFFQRCLTRVHWQSRPQLFHLGNDLGEKNDVASEQPEVVAQLQLLVQSVSHNLPQPPLTAARGSRALRLLQVQQRVLRVVFERFWPFEV